MLFLSCWNVYLSLFLFYLFMSVNFCSITVQNSLVHFTGKLATHVISEISFYWNWFRMYLFLLNKILAVVHDWVEFDSVWSGLPLNLCCVYRTFMGRHILVEQYTSYEYTLTAGRQVIGLEGHNGSSMYKVGCLYVNLMDTLYTGSIGCITKRAEVLEQLSLNFSWPPKHECVCTNNHQ